MTRLSIHLLGTLQVSLDGEPITGFRAETAQALLAYLAMHAGVPCHRASLAGLLWSDYGESSALTDLRQALRRLRRAIGDGDASPPFLQTTRTTIALNPESDYWLDVDAFTAALDAVQGHAHRPVETCAVCAQRLGEAVELYRGEFLAGFSLDSALFEEWVVVERERLHGQALEALGHLAAYHEAQGTYEEAVRYARRALALELWREEAHRALMRVLALSGQRSAALAQYDVCRHILEEDLGVEPGEETTRLYERIREEADLIGLANLSGLGALSPHNLPAQLTPFIGRERELAEIAERLADPTCWLLTLVGPGGSGKTRLALEAAAREVANHEHGVFFVSLGPLSSVDAIVPTVARALSFSFYGTGGSYAAAPQLPAAKKHAPRRGQFRAPGRGRKHHDSHPERSARGQDPGHLEGQVGCARGTPLPSGRDARSCDSSSRHRERRYSEAVQCRPALPVQRPEGTTGPGING
jgi:DNA-binding SARP family transcriptional activator